MQAQTVGGALVEHEARSHGSLAEFRASRVAASLGYSLGMTDGSLIALHS